MMVNYAEENTHYAQVFIANKEQTTYNIPQKFTHNTYADTCIRYTGCRSHGFRATGSIAMDRTT